MISKHTGFDFRSKDGRRRCKGSTWKKVDKKLEFKGKVRKWEGYYKIFDEKRSVYLLSRHGKEIQWTIDTPAEIWGAMVGTTFSKARKAYFEEFGEKPALRIIRVKK